MPVEKKIDLNKPLSEEDLEYLEETADRLERVVERRDDALDKLDEVEKEVDDKAEKIERKIGRVVKRKDELSASLSPLAGIGGDIGFPEIPISGTQFGGQGEGLPAKPKDIRSRAPAAYRRGPDYIPGYVETPLDIERKVETKINEFLNASGAPYQFIKGKITKFARLSVVGSALFFGIEMSEFIIDTVKKMFGAGGDFDVRKMILDQAREISSLDHILKINSGQVYFTSDTSELIRQGTQTGFVSNTRQSLNGHKVFLQVRES